MKATPVKGKKAVVLKPTPKPTKKGDLKSSAAEITLRLGHSWFD